MRHIFALCVFFASPALAEQVQVFTEALDLTPPEGFSQAFETRTDAAFLREYTMPGETVEEWSQLITLTGVKGGRDSGALARQMAEGFAAVCPQSLTSVRLDAPQVPGATAVFAAFLACGDNGEGRSEAVAFLILQGADLYTAQWAELGPRSAAPRFAKALWYPRLEALARDLRLCGPGATPGCRH